METSDRKLVVFVTWLAGITATLVALMVPLGFFSMTYSALSSATQTTAAIKGEMAGQVIGSVPEMWQYQTLRLEASIAQHAHYPGAERVVILNKDNKVVAQYGDMPLPPMLSRSVQLFESGTPVGRLEVSRSMRGLLLETAAAALAGLLLGAFIFLALRTLPLRALNRAFVALSREKQRAQVTLHSIGDAVITTDALERIDYMNPIAELLTGWNSKQASGQPLSAVFRVISELTGRAMESPLKRAIAENKIVPLADHATLVRNDGSTIAVEDSAAPIVLPGAAVVGGVLIFRDVTAARSRSQQLHWQASHDALTGLPNRSEFERHLDDGLNSARTSDSHHAVCYLDLDKFKIINDTCGHAAGDELLRQIAEVLQQQLRQSDLLARLGGDEFGVLLLGCPLERAQVIAESLLAAVGAFRFSHENSVFSVGVSIGIVELTARAVSRERLMSAADSACYAAKEGGRNRVVVYHPEDRSMLNRVDEMDWTARIVQALDENRLALYYQEHLSLGSHTGPGRHIELLLRLVDQDGNIIVPGAFLPTAERHELMPRIDRWVVTTAFAGHDALTKTFGADFLCCINLSGASLSDEHLATFIREQAAFHHVQPDTICFEVAESAAINQLRNTARLILDLKADGFRFALDNVGAGMSSIAYLRTLTIDYLKIDGSLVKDVETDALSKTLVRSVNEIGHAVGLHTVAEQVASEAALEQIRQIGVDFAQGFVIAEPAPIPLGSPPGRISAEAP